MKTKFLIIGIVVIVLVAIITSYLSILYLTKPILLADQQGTIMLGITGGEELNVIVVDTRTGTTISDLVQFSGVSLPAQGQPPNQYSTDVTGGIMGSGPLPFLIENVGTGDANVYFSSFNGIVDGVPNPTGLFKSPLSSVKFRVGGYVSMYAAVGYKEAAGYCYGDFGATPLCFLTNNVPNFQTLVYDADGPGVGMDPEILAITRLHHYVQEVDSLCNANPPAYCGEHGGDEAYVDIQIGVDRTEGIGSRSVIFYIKGVQP